jgi:hypothetical protein
VEKSLSTNGDQTFSRENHHRIDYYLAYRAKTKKTREGNLGSSFLPMKLFC